MLTFGITVFGVNEPVAPARPHLGGGGGWQAAVDALMEHRAALRYLVAVSTFMLGFSAALPYLTLFIVVDIHQSEQTALLLAAATLVVTAVAAVGFGRLAARTGPKPVLVVGWSLIALAAVGGLAIRGLPETVAVVLVAGIGNGAATAVGGLS